MSDGEYARSYLELYDLAAKHWKKLRFSSESLALEESQWLTHLQSLGILTSIARRLVSEAALLGGAMEKGVSESNATKKRAIAPHQSLKVAS